LIVKNINGYIFIKYYIIVQYLESTRNYFYKQYKNDKKKRISFESYNRVMKGGENGRPAEPDDKRYNVKDRDQIDRLKKNAIENTEFVSQFDKIY
jgi:hypothetical protein